MHSVLMSDRSFRPTQFGWMTYLVRKVTKKWKLLCIGDLIRVRAESSSDDIFVKVTDIVISNDIQTIVNSRNYLNICPWACSVPMAKQSLAISLFGVNDLPSSLPEPLILINFTLCDNIPDLNKKRTQQCFELTRSII